jgi:uncharacterized protein with gpF-like domain
LSEIVSGIVDKIKVRTIQAVNRNSEYIGTGNIDRGDFSSYTIELQNSANYVKNQIRNDLGNLRESDIPSAVYTAQGNIINGSVQDLSRSLSKIVNQVEQTLADNVNSLLDERIDAVNRIFDAFKNARVPAITNTAASNITSGIQSAMYDAVGQTYIWLTQRDGRVRAAHAKADGQKPDARGFFTVGGEKTPRPCHRTMSAGNRINCRCLLYPAND